MTVSIVLPIYNRAATLARCLDSIRAQTFSDWELLAVDDGSDDDSVRVVESYGDARVRLLKHAVNRGPSAARNTAIAEARGEFIAFIDSDDEWLPAKLEKQLTLLRDSGLDACGCEYWLVVDTREVRIHLSSPASWAKELHTKCELGNGTTLLARRTAALEIGPLDEALRLYEDWDWVLRFVGKFRYGVVNEPLARVHASGLRDSSRFAQGAEHFLKKHDREFVRLGETHRRWVRSKHYEFVAANAFAQRLFGLGCRYLLKSLREMPSRSPWRLGALPLAACDAALGTSLLQRAATWQRKRSAARSS
jgi:glycosyltransferase involved in cell wall biosynthesis